MMLIDEDWRADAACLGAEADLFFPERGESSVAARVYCATCPVVGDCLEYALVHRIHVGIWGGTSERERRRMRRSNVA